MVEVKLCRQDLTNLSGSAMTTTKTKSIMMKTTIKKTMGKKMMDFSTMTSSSTHKEANSRSSCKSKIYLRRRSFRTSEACRISKSTKTSSGLNFSKVLSSLFTDN